MLKDEEWREANGIMYKEEKVYVPKNDKLRAEIIRLHHDTLIGGHGGQWKTVELVTRNFWWPGVTKKIKQYVEEHDACQCNKNCTEQPAGKLMPNSIPERPWTHISADFIIKLPLAQGYNSISSLLTPIPPSYMVAPESNIANTHYSKKLINPNINSTKARPDNTALSIQRGHPPSCVSTESSCSSSPSLMDDSPPLDCNYTERVATQNNMDIEADNTPPTAGPLRYNFAMLPLQTLCAPHKDASNDPTPSNNFNTSLEPSLPTVIPYSANVLADPNLWDSNFTAMSLFSTNKFLQRDVCNMACSLQRMACFLKQHSLKGHDGNNILQLELFGKSAWDFISVIFESGWDQLHLSENTSIYDNISTHFGSIQTHDKATENKAYPKTLMVRKTLPPISLCPSKEQMENSKKH